MTHYSTLVYLSDEVSFANFYKYCFEKFEKVSEVSLISVTDSHQFKQYTTFIVKSFSIVPHFCLPLLFSYRTSLHASLVSFYPQLDSS